MKFALVAVFAAAVAVAVRADDCPFSELVKLDSLINEPSVRQCGVDSSFSFFPPMNDPTDEQLSAMCGSTACHSTIAALRALDPADCTLHFVSGASFNVKKTIDRYDALCPASRRSLRQ